MRDPIANVLGSIPGARSTLRSLADTGVLVDALIVPVARWSPPATGPTFGALIGLPSIAPAVAWDCASAADGGVVESLPGAGLTAVPLTPADADALLERRGVGLYNGSDFRSFRVLEIAGATDFAASSSTAVEPAAGEFALLFVFRAGARYGFTVGLAGKRAGGVGYALELDTDGTLRWTVSDGGASTVALAGDHGDGAWHFVVAWRSGTGFGLYSDLTAAATGTDGGLGSLASAGVFRIGRPDASTPAAAAQYAIAAYFVGSAVSTIIAGRNALRAWWRDRVTAAPSSVTTARTGSSSASSVCDRDDEGGDVLAFVGTGAPAWLRMDGVSGPHGLQIAPAFTSILGTHDVGDSDVVGGGWDRRDTPDVTLGAGDGPAGFRNAVRLSKTSGNPLGRLSHRVALVAGTKYHFAMRVKWDGGGPGDVGVDAGPIWRIRDADDTTTVAGPIGTSAVGGWAWHVITWTAASSADYQIQYLASKEDSDETGEVLVQYASGGEGYQPMPLPMLHKAAAAVGEATYCSIDFPAGSGLASRADRGALIVDAVALPGVPVALGTDQRVLASVSDSSTDNARQLGASGGTMGPKLHAEVFAGGVHEVDQATADIVPATWEATHRYALLWDLAGGINGTTATFQLEVDGANPIGSADAFTAAPDGDTVAVGLSVDGTGWWVGGIQRVRVLALATSGSSAL